MQYYLELTAEIWCLPSSRPQCSLRRQILMSLNLVFSEALSEKNDTFSCQLFELYRISSISKK
jgi:hypothetical protein